MATQGLLPLVNLAWKHGHDVDLHRSSIGPDTVHSLISMSYASDMHGSARKSCYTSHELEEQRVRLLVETPRYHTIKVFLCYPDGRRNIETAVKTQRILDECDLSCQIQP